MENVGKVSVSDEIGVVGDDYKFKVTFLSNDGDLPLLTVDGGSSGDMSVTEIVKGSTISEVQRVTLYSDSSISAGQFQLVIGEFTCALIDYDADGVTLKSKVEWLPSLEQSKIAVSLVESNNNFETTKFRTIWEITFLQESGNRDAMGVKWSGNGCSECAAFNDGFVGGVQVVVGTETNGSESMDGSFKLSYGGLLHQEVETTASIPVGISAFGLKQELEKLDSITGISGVTKSNSLFNENTDSYTITFNSKSNPGDLPALKVLLNDNGDTLSGGGEVFVNTVTNGEAPLGGTFELRCNLGGVACSSSINLNVHSTALKMDELLNTIPEINSNFGVSVVKSSSGAGYSYAVTFSHLDEEGSGPYPRLFISSRQLTGNSAAVSVSSSNNNFFFDSQSTESTSVNYKITSFANLPSVIGEVQELVCGRPTTHPGTPATTFTVSFNGVTSATISIDDYLSPSLLPDCLINDPDSPSPCKNDGSTLEEKLEAMSSVGNVTVVGSR